MVDWRSGNIPDLSPGRLGGVAVGSNLGRTLAACGEGKSLCVRPVYGLWCAHSLINLHPVSGSVEDGFELCRMYIQVIRLMGAGSRNSDIEVETPREATHALTGAIYEVVKTALPIHPPLVCVTLFSRRLESATWLLQSAGRCTVCHFHDFADARPVMFSMTSFLDFAQAQSGGRTWTSGRPYARTCVYDCH